MQKSFTERYWYNLITLGCWIFFMKYASDGICSPSVWKNSSSLKKKHTETEEITHLQKVEYMCKVLKISHSRGEKPRLPHRCLTIHKLNCQISTIPLLEYTRQTRHNIVPSVVKHGLRLLFLGTTLSLLCWTVLNMKTTSVHSIKLSQAKKRTQSVILI